jgi:hypothetical protein
MRNYPWSNLNFLSKRVVVAQAVALQITVRKKSLRWFFKNSQKNKVHLHLFSLSEKDQ